MAESQEHAGIEQQAVPLTAPMTEVPAEGLPEEPTTPIEELRASARALSAGWQHTHPSENGKDSLPARLKSLKSRLAARLLACKQIANTRELTPQLEFLESTRALEGVCGR